MIDESRCEECLGTGVKGARGPLEHDIAFVRKLAQRLLNGGFVDLQEGLRVQRVADAADARIAR